MAFWRGFSIIKKFAPSSSSGPCLLPGPAGMIGRPPVSLTGLLGMSLPGSIGLFDGLRIPAHGVSNLPGLPRMPAAVGVNPPGRPRMVFNKLSLSIYFLSGLGMVPDKFSTCPQPLGGPWMVLDPFSTFINFFGRLWVILNEFSSLF